MILGKGDWQGDELLNFDWLISEAIDWDNKFQRAIVEAYFAKGVLKKDFHDTVIIDQESLCLVITDDS